MHQYRKLTVWQKAVELTTEIYKISQEFPKSEIYGLTSQMRRCAVSIPSNIAEGAGRTSPKEFAHFLGIANGSAFELETQIIIAYKLDYVDEETCKNLGQLGEEVQKMIYGLLKKLKQ